MHLIDYPEDVQAKMEEHSVHMYDPRWPIDNSWIPPPEPDTWTFLKEIGRGTEEPEEDVKLRARIAAKNGIIQRFDDSEEADAFEYLAGASEAKLQRAVDIGEEDDEEASPGVAPVAAAAPPIVDFANFDLSGFAASLPEPEPLTR